MGKVSNDIMKKILEFQRNELTEHLFYKALSEKARDRNSELLKKISEDDKFKSLEKLQEITDSYIKKADEIALAKEKEIMGRG